jgi:repressor LexA
MDQDDKQPNDVILPLTVKEKSVLEYIESYMSREGIAPSFSEIKTHFNLASYNSVQRYLKQLQTKRYLHLPGGNQKRAMMLLKSSAAAKEALGQVLAFRRNEIRNGNKNNAVSDTTKVPVADGPLRELLSLPLLGKVAAGLPIEALEHEEFIEVPPSMVRDPKRSFTLEVKGNSMIEDGIFDGDIIIVQEQAIARNGEIVVASVNHEATVKRFYLHQGQRLARPQVELRPANAEMESMFFSPEKVQIRGIVVGLMRKF